MNKNWIIIITIIIASLVNILLIVILAIFCSQIAVNKGINFLEKKFYDTIDEINNVDPNHDLIIKELNKQKIVKNDWKYIDNSCGMNLETQDCSTKYYFYIEKDKYNSYKNYWLEDVDKKTFYNKYNYYLYEDGDYAFKLIKISKISYNINYNYKGINLDKDKDYYSIKLYDKALYYKYINTYKDENNYETISKYDYDADSITKEYISYIDNGKIIIKETK